MPIDKFDKERLSRIVDFLRGELDEFKKKFLQVDFRSYKENRDLCRNLERCIENILNPTLDMAKIILVAERLEIPQTYGEYFLVLYSRGLIEKDTALTLAEGVKLRNILAHQYLDIRWKRIEKFIRSDYKAYEVFLNAVNKYLTSSNSL